MHSNGNAANPPRVKSLRSDKVWNLITNVPEYIPWPPEAGYGVPEVSRGLSTDENRLGAQGSDLALSSPTGSLNQHLHVSMSRPANRKRQYRFASDAIIFRRSSRDML